MSDTEPENTPLREKIREFPKAPGVYLMKDGKDRVIYIGKAKSLRDRVSSYFGREEGLQPRTRIMVRQVANVDYLPTDSEVDALLLESRLVKDVQPKYNVDLKDGKSYPLLAVTTREDFPRVFITRERDLKNVKYFGPFLDAWGLRAAVKYLQKAFRFRTCTMEIAEHDPRLRNFRPCLLYHLNQCTAPCAGRIASGAYKRDVERLKRFLFGRKKSVLRELEALMKRAAGRKEYEAAAQYRDQIRALQSLSKRSLVGDLTGAGPFRADPKSALAELQKILDLDFTPRSVEGMDIATLQGSESVGSLVSFIDGTPFKDGYRRYKIKTVTGVNDYAMLAEVVTRRFTRLAEEGEIFPDVLLIDGGVGQLHAVEKTFVALGIDPPILLSLAKKEELVHAAGRGEPLRLERRSPALQLLQYVRDEAHRFAGAYHHILRRKKVIQ